MGVMRFTVPNPERIKPDTFERTYIASAEGTPWRCFVEPTTDGFLVRRRLDDSGNLCIPWPVPGFGEPQLLTASLMVRERPYLLPVELARGTLHRLRNQLSAWQLGGLQVPAAVHEQVHKANLPFSSAATIQNEPIKASQEAEASLVESLRGMRLLADEYTRQVLALRHSQHAKLSLLLGTHLEVPAPLDEFGPPLAAAFNAASLNLNWRKVEESAGKYNWADADKLVDWCRRKNLRVIGGPLVCFDEACLPDWLYLWEGDLENIQSYMLSWVEKCVQHFQGRVGLWHCSSRMNFGQVLSLSEEERLRLSVSALEVIRKNDVKTPMVISFDRPWAEYMAGANVDVTPLQFADALARADLGLSGLGLELNFGWWPGGTLPRDLLEVSRLIDNWSSLGLPLILFISLPSAALEAVMPGAPRTIAGPGADTLSIEAQQEFAQRLVRMLLCKQSVQGIIWNQTFDARRNVLAGGGLFDAAGQAKPVLAALTEIRKQHVI